MGDPLGDKAPMSSVPQGTETYPVGPHTPFPDQTEFQKDPMNTDDPAQSVALGPGETVFTSNPALACPSSWGTDPEPTIPESRSGHVPVQDRGTEGGLVS